MALVSWMAIIMNTRLPGTNLYAWCRSFDPLMRTYLRAEEIPALSDAKLVRLGRVLGAQVTDHESQILALHSDEYKGAKIAEGDFDLKTLKTAISAVESKIQRAYKPSLLMHEFLRQRAVKHHVPIPSFVPKLEDKSGDTKRTGEDHKRKREAFLQEAWHAGKQPYEEQGDWGQQHVPERGPEDYWDHRSHDDVYEYEHWLGETRQRNCTTPICVSKGIDHTHGVDTCFYKIGGKFHDQQGKGKPPWRPYNGKGSDKGRSGKGKGSSGGKSLAGSKDRGKGGKGTSPYVPRAVCSFCHKSGHTRSTCNQELLLQQNEPYQKHKRSRPPQEIFVYSLLEDAVGTTSCEKCLKPSCTPNTCFLPIEQYAFERTSNHFANSGMWDAVARAKAAPTHSSNPVLTRDAFQFGGVYEKQDDPNWGQQWDGASPHVDNSGTSKPISKEEDNGDYST